MTAPARKTVLLLVLALAVAALLGWPRLERLVGVREPPARGPAAVRPIPVEAASVRHGPMELRRVFSGALEASAQFIVAPKVSGRIEQLHARLADTVTRGALVAELDDAEYVQAVAQARAGLEVAQATVRGAHNALTIAQRELSRASRLRDQGMVSEAQLDAARAKQLDQQAQLKVAEALASKAEAELRTARIRLGYTQVTADWTGGGNERVVAERFVHEGETVAANGPLLRIVELSPLIAVVFVTERDYARLDNGQRAVLTTDAWPGETFAASIARIAPVFREATRQARVEMTVANGKQLLKPGMFVRATIVLGRVPDALQVPEQALTVRDGQTGVFVVNEAGDAVSWQPVEPGIRDGGHVELRGGGIEGRVVVLGQQLLEDGAPIVLPERGAAVAGTAPARQQ